MPEGSPAYLRVVGAGRLLWWTAALILDHRPDLTGEARQELLARRAALGRFSLDPVASACERG